MHLPTYRRLRCLVPLILAMTVLGAADPAPLPTAPATAPGKSESLYLRETRQYLADITQERNGLRETNETLRNRQGLLAIYGGAMTLLAMWLVVLHLRSGRKTTSDTEEFFGSADARPNTTVAIRKNATITIRNGSTQQAEMTDQVQTRRAFARSDTGTQQRPTRSFTRPATPTANHTVAPELDPTQPPVAPTTTAHTRPRTTTTQRPTVRVEQHSDRLEPVEVAVKPGTAPIGRPTGVVAKR